MNIISFRSGLKTMSQKGLWLCFVALALLGPALRAAEEPMRFEFTETHMGSPVHIVLYTTDAQTAKNASAKAYARVAALDRTFSDYNPESELMKLVEHFAAGPAEAVAVSNDLFDILKKSQAVAEATGGAFDITAAPVIRQWRRARRERKLPSKQNIQEALGRVGYRRVTLLEDSKKVRLEPGTRLDLGGIAKGYTAQAAVEELRKLNLNQVLVSVAGDIAVGTAPPGRAGWSVAVAGLDPSRDEPLAMLELTNACVSSSGDAERFVDIDGHRYSHIVDVKTGYGIQRRATVTVVSTDGSSADAYATSLYALGVAGGDLLGRLRNPPELAVIWLEQGRPAPVVNQAFERLPKVASGQGVDQK